MGQASNLAISDKWRRRIAESVMLSQLIEYAEGRIDMTNSRANTILRLVGKVLPDLQSIQVDVAVEHKTLNKLELEQRLLSLGHNPSMVWNQLNGSVITVEPEPINQSDIDELELMTSNTSIESTE